METHTKKHILGFVGLAAVAAMTAVAYTIPTPDAAAVTSDTATYTVEVHEKASVVFQDGLDGAVFNKTPASITAKYSEVIKISYYLSYTDKSGNPVVEQLIRSFCPANADGSCPEDQLINDSSQSSSRRNAPSRNASSSSASDYIGDYYVTGTDTFNLDFDQYGGYGIYTLHVTVTTTQSFDEDYATFEYSAGKPADQGTDENGNPIIDIAVDNDEVDHACIQLNDANGNPLFVDENGNPTPVCGKVVNGHITITLPFDQYNIPDGEYTIVISYYDIHDNLLYTEEMKYVYGAASQRKEIAVPDTGFLGLGNLNFSNPDYWIAGLAGLTALTGGAYYVAKRSKSRR